MIDQNGVPVWQADYEAFGRAVVNSAQIENNLRFSGQYFDGETGLHYNWHRFYMPEVGKYNQTDPLGIKEGINLYKYAHNNSVNYIDPDGQFPFGFIGIVIGVYGTYEFVNHLILQKKAIDEHNDNYEKIVNCLKDDSCTEEEVKDFQDSYVELPKTAGQSACKGTGVPGTALSPLSPLSPY